METATVEQVHNANATNNLPNNNTAQQAPTATTSNTKKIETISTASFKMRADELFRLAKQKKISDERLLTCLNDLMLLPIDTSYEFKIKSLSRFSSHGFLTTKEISTLVCNALLTYNTETIKKRIRYLDFLHSKNLIEENDYFNVVQALMTLQE